MTLCIQNQKRRLTLRQWMPSTFQVHRLWMLFLPFLIAFRTRRLSLKARSQKTLFYEVNMPAQYEIPKLPYDFGDLEPVISAEIMQLHYTKHHQGYVNNLNKALEQYADAESKQQLAQMIALQSAIKFNGGGNVNHSIFWTNLTPEKNGGGNLAA